MLLSATHGRIQKSGKEAAANVKCQEQLEMKSCPMDLILYQTFKAVLNS